MFFLGFLLPSDKTLMQKDYVRVKLPVSALLAVCVLMSTVSWQSKVISSNAVGWGFFDGRSGRFFFFGTGMCFKCLFFGGR